jgi:hypothetical protein
VLVCYWTGTHFENSYSITENRHEYGYTVTCVETTYRDGSTKAKWSISAEKIRLPSGWRNIGSAASPVPSDGVYSYEYIWYQLDQSVPSLRDGGGKIC